MRFGAVPRGTGSARREWRDGTMGVKATEAAARRMPSSSASDSTPWLEGEASDRSFRLPGDQDDLIRQIAALNKNVSRWSRRRQRRYDRMD